MVVTKLSRIFLRVKRVNTESSD